MVIDNQADDLDKVYRSRGTIIPPDEILDMLKPGNLKIPVETDPGVELPESGLLECIHYYVSKKVSKSEQRRVVEGSMDETALLAMGMLVESWIDELIDENTVRMFLDNYDFERPVESDLERGSGSDEGEEDDEEEEEEQEEDVDENDELGVYYQN